MLWMLRLHARRRKPSLEKESSNPTRSFKWFTKSAAFTKFELQAIFISFWQMSETFYMRTLRSFLDRVCLDNFGWFYSSLGRAGSSQYMNQWDIRSLAACLMDRKFCNCNEEQVFEAVISYCRSKAEFEQLVPGLYQSCGGYLRYLQSVPRSLKFHRYQ